MQEYRIDADLVIVGDGNSYKNGSIIVKEKKIIYAGETEHAPNVDNLYTTPVIMPGMWDVHLHFTGIRKPSLETSIFTSPYEAAMRCTWDVKQILNAGFTSVREMGGLGVYLNNVITEGIIKGPRIYGAGSVISTTGGHGDLHAMNLDILHQMINANVPFIGELADGVGEVLKAVRKQTRKGAEVIKYCASGGVMSELDHPVYQQFSNKEQETIVKEAELSDLAVAAHCHGRPGIKSALNAGVKTIEHGTYLDEDLADLMIEKDAILVPTRYVVQKLMDGAEEMGVPSYAMDKMRAMYDQHTDAIRIAIRKGVKIALGTDIFTSGPKGIFEWGQNAMELEYLVDLGLDAEKAIMAATSVGPLTLGDRAPKSGQLKKGYDADMLFLNENPIQNISSLSNMKNITAIIKQGEFVKKS